MEQIAAACDNRNENGFPLTILPLSFQEKIITKFNEKSYFRMQQTCRHIMELVKNSRNITVFVKGRITVRWEIEEDDSSDPQKSSFSFYYVRLPNCKYPYGIRAVGVGRPPHPWNDFEGYCNALKRQRITCRSFEFDLLSLSKEHYVTLLNILKPERGFMNSEKMDIYEALSEAKLPEYNKLQLEIDSERAHSAMEKLLPIWQDVFFDIEGFCLSGDDYGRYIRCILQFLSFHPLPNLRKFEVHLVCDEHEKLPTTEKLMEWYGDFNPTILAKETKAIVKCDFQNNGSYCNVFHFDYNQVDIRYAKGVCRNEFKDF